MMAPIVHVSIIKSQATKRSHITHTHIQKSKQHGIHQVSVLPTRQDRQGRSLCKRTQRGTSVLRQRISSKQEESTPVQKAGSNEAKETDFSVYSVLRSKASRGKGCESREDDYRDSLPSGSVLEERIGRRKGRLRPDREREQGPLS